MLTGVYLIGVGAGAIPDRVHPPQRPVALGLTQAQWVSVASMVAGGRLLLVLPRPRRRARARAA